MTADKNPNNIKTIFEEISPVYDKFNNIISLGTHYIIKFLAIRSLKIQPETSGLDICCGTGDFVNIISKFYPKTKILGLDFSPAMIKKAKTKNPKGIFIQGNAVDLPFGEMEFDFITMGFGLRNIENRTSALKEIHRTLNNGGKFLHLDFGYHNFMSKIFDIIVFLSTVFNNNIAKNYTYLIISKNDFPEPDKLIKEIEQQGFKCENSKSYMFGIINSQVYKKLSD